MSHDWPRLPSWGLSLSIWPCPSFTYTAGHHGTSLELCQAASPALLSCAKVTIDTSKMFCYIEHMTEVTQAAKSLIRTFAGSARRLDEDLNLTHLQAIVRLHKLDADFAGHWYGHPWLVLADGFCLPADMPVPKMLDSIEAHGRPVGIAGVAQITARQDRVLALNFCKDAASRKRVADSQKEAAAMVAKANAEVDRMAKDITEQKVREFQGGKQ